LQEVRRAQKERKGGELHAHIVIQEDVFAAVFIREERTGPIVGYDFAHVRI